MRFLGSGKIALAVAAAITLFASATCAVDTDTENLDEQAQEQDPRSAAENDSEAGGEGETPVPFVHPAIPTDPPVDLDDGKRYAIEEGVEILADGTVIRTSGLVEVETRQMTDAERAERLERKTVDTEDLTPEPTLKVGERWERACRRGWPKASRGKPPEC